MPIVFGYTPATNIVVVTGGTAGVPATFADFVTADRAGSYTVMDAIATAMNLTLDRLIRPVEFRALKITFTLAGTNAGAGDTVDITGTDAWGNAQTESINVAAGNGAYVSVKYWRTITDIDCTGFADGVGTIDAVQPQWGVIWDCGGGFYVINSKLEIGDEIILTYLQSSSECVHFADVTDSYFQIKNNATFQTGSLTAIDNSPVEGSTIIIDVKNFSADYQYIAEVGSTIKFYASSFEFRPSHSDHSVYVADCNVEIKETNFKNTLIYGGNADNTFLQFEGSINVNYMYTSKLKAFVLHANPNQFDNVRIYSAGSVIGLLARNDFGLIEVKHFKVDSEATIGDVVAHWNTDINLIDADLPSPFSKRIYNDGQWIREKFTCNIHVIDKDGTNINGATVACEDQFGTPIFSVNTGADGKIAEQTITYRQWTGTDETETIYSPHKFTISKAGYETLELDDVTVDIPIVWHLELLPALVEADVRDAVNFGEDKTGSLDLPAITDVEKGVQFDNLTKTGTFKSPAEADVRDGEGYGAGDVEFTGALDLPSINDVEDGVFFDSGTKEGNFEAPSEDDVEDGIGYGSLGMEFEGNFESPAESEVMVGVGYGANGVEFLGTYAILRGTNLTAYLSESVSLTGELKP